MGIVHLDEELDGLVEVPHTISNSNVALAPNTLKTKASAKMVTDDASKVITFLAGSDRVLLPRCIVCDRSSKFLEQVVHPDYSRHACSSG
jgi:hypothetical protein